MATRSTLNKRIGKLNERIDKAETPQERQKLQAALQANERKLARKTQSTLDVSGPGPRPLPSPARNNAPQQSTHVTPQAKREIQRNKYRARMEKSTAANQITLQRKLDDMEAQWAQEDEMAARTGARPPPTRNDGGRLADAYARDIVELRREFGGARPQNLTPTGGLGTLSPNPMRQPAPGSSLRPPRAVAPMGGQPPVGFGGTSPPGGSPSGGLLAGGGVVPRGGAMPQGGAMPPATSAPTGEPIQDYNAQQMLEGYLGQAGVAPEAAAIDRGLLERAEAEDWDAATAEVAPEQLVQERINALLAEDSPYLQQRRARAMLEVNAAGRLNTALGGTAGELAAIQAALPIAQADAARMSQQAMANQSALNAAAQQNAQLGTQVGLANQAAANQALAQNAAYRQAANLAGAQAANQAALTGAGIYGTLEQAGMDVEAAQALQEGQQQFQAGQAELGRQHQAAMQQAQFGQETGILGQRQRFAAAESALERGLRTGMQATQIQAQQDLQDTNLAFQGDENAQQRLHQSHLQTSNQTHQAGMQGDRLSWEGGQRDMQRQLQLDMQGRDHAFSDAQNQLGRQHAFDILHQQQTFQGTQADITRQHQLGMQANQIGHQAAQQTRQIEANMTLAGQQFNYQEALQLSDQTWRSAMQGSQQDFASDQQRLQNLHSQDMQQASFDHALMAQDQQNQFTAGQNQASFTHNAAMNRASQLTQIWTTPDMTSRQQQAGVRAINSVYGAIYPNLVDSPPPDQGNQPPARTPTTGPGSPVPENRPWGMNQEQWDRYQQREEDRRRRERPWDYA